MSAYADSWRAAPSRLAEREGIALLEAAAVTALSVRSLPESRVHWIAQLPGRARWVCFLAYAGTVPAGTGALFVGGDAGWLGFAAILPEFRGHDGHAALLGARIDAARARRCTVLATETGVCLASRPSHSYRNILRAGFVEASARDNSVAPMPTVR